MTLYLVAYLATAITFLAIDAIWLGLIARDFYARQLGDLMLARPKLGIAAGFYTLYILGVVVFAVMPGIRADSWLTALGLGLLLGLVAYGTYNITNMATLKDWPVTMSALDLAWGSLLTGVAALSGYVAVRVLAGA
ncbi:MAG: DUF2177 family protein [Pseudomonadota bacterium]